jgi:hypothetical protein
MRLIFVSVILTCAVSSVACRRPHVRPSPQDNDPSVPLTLNERLAQQIPGFGGLFRQKDASIAVYLIDLSGERRARKVVQLERLREGAKEAPLQFLKGQYTYVELRRIHATIPNLGRGISGYGPDISRNRYLIQITSEKEIAPVCAILRKAQLPLKAFIIEIAPLAEVL